MQRVTLDIPVTDKAIGDAFKVYSNADRAGLAGASIDYTRAITGSAAVPFFPLATPEEGFLVGPFLTGPFLGPPLPTTPHQVTSQPLYHGWYRFAVVPIDAIGNEGPDAPTEFRVFLTSGPKAPTRFRQTGSSGGRPVFAFDAPPQLA